MSRSPAPSSSSPRATQPSGAAPDAERDAIDTVRRVADLARLAFDERELPALAAQFARTLKQFEALAALDVEGVEPMTGAAPISDVTRPDVPRPSLTPDEALQNAPERDGDFYAVPKTVGGDE